MDGTKPSINNGAAATLYIRPTGGVDKRALIKFDLSGPQFAGKTILAAILYIYDDQGDRTFSVDVLPVTSAWDEMSVTWDTAPTFDSLAAGAFSLTNTKCVRGGYIRPDVIQNWIDHPEANFGVMLYPPSGAGDVKLSSREGIMAPKLWVELAN